MTGGGSHSVLVPHNVVECCNDRQRRHCCATHIRDIMKLRLDSGQTSHQTNYAQYRRSASLRVGAHWEVKWNLQRGRHYRWLQCSQTDQKPSLVGQRERPLPPWWVLENGLLTDVQRGGNKRRDNYANAALPAPRRSPVFLFFFSQNLFAPICPALFLGGSGPGKAKAPYSNEFPSAKFQVLAIGVFRK
jgi:hypothetical protein